MKLFESNKRGIIESSFAIGGVFALLFLVTSFFCRTAVAQNEKSGSPYEVATFAGGCFWCMEHPFDEIEGVISTTSGYTGGTKKDPTYKQVSSGTTGHAESVQVLYDPAKVSYEKLLNVFWHNIDPTTKDRQFNDVGSQYRTAIFYHTQSQKLAAEASKANMEASGIFGAPIVTEITEAGVFYPAEDYHQDYYIKSAAQYKFYRFFSGRDQYLEKIWGSHKEAA